jgi:glycine/D-amino acid oxidase-like deaminating enzyme
MKSIWDLTVPEILNTHNSVDCDLSCDVTIIGGGLTGLSCAYYLSKHGLKVILLEKDYLMSKTSGNTTGKITAQHGLFYNYTYYQSP